MTIDYVKGNPWAGDVSELPFFELVGGIYENIANLNNAKKESTKQKYRMKLLASVLDIGGIPGSQLNKMYQNIDPLIKSYKKGDYLETVARSLGYTDYQIEQRKKKGKTVKMKKVKTAFD